MNKDIPLRPTLKSATTMALCALKRALSGNLL